MELSRLAQPLKMIGPRLYHLLVISIL